MTADLDQLPPDATKQLGSALSPYQLYQAVDPTTGDWYDYGSSLAARDIDDMLAADGRARAVEQALTLPLRAAPFTMKAAKGDRGEYESASASLELMSTPLDMVIGQAAQSLIYRATFLEKIFTVDRGQVDYAQLAWRPPDVCAMTRSQKTGDVTGFRQTVWGATDAVRIPAAKAVVFLHGANRDPVRGVSEMQVSYRCFRDKQKLRLLWMILCERAAAPWIVAQTSAGQEPAVSKTLASMRSGGVAAVSGIDKLDVLNVAGDAAAVFQSAVTFLDSEMAGSILAGFLDLASSASRGAGSLALSQDQTDFYQASMDAAAREIAQQARSQIIAPLCRYNFGVDAAVPDVTLGPIGGATTEQMLTLVQAFAAAPPGQSFFPTEFIDEIVLRISGALDLDVDKIQAEITERAAQAATSPAAAASAPLHAATDVLTAAAAKAA